MEKDDLEALFARIRTWPPEWQEYTAGSLRSIEEMMACDGRKYLMTEEEHADIMSRFVEDDDELADADDAEPVASRKR